MYTYCYHLLEVSSRGVFFGGGGGGGDFILTTVPSPSDL